MEFIAHSTSLLSLSQTPLSKAATTKSTGRGTGTHGPETGSGTEHTRVERIQLYVGTPRDAGGRGFTSFLSPPLRARSCSSPHAACSCSCVRCLLRNRLEHFISRCACLAAQAHRSSSSLTCLLWVLQSRHQLYVQRLPKQLSLHQIQQTVTLPFALRKAWTT